jgi:heme-degrading monooxygenase HmoA
MILRAWKGVAKEEEADQFARHLRMVTFPGAAKIKGFVRGTVTRRDLGAGVEFLVLTEWETLAAIKEFAGEDAELAVVPPEVKAMLADYDRYATHYQVVDRYEPKG